MADNEIRIEDMSPQEAFLAGIAFVHSALKETAEMCREEDAMCYAILLMTCESVSKIHANVKAQFEDGKK